MTRLPALALAVLLTLGCWIPAQEPVKDSRLAPFKDLNPKFDAKKQFLWTPPTSLEAWEKRKRELREQVLVANGLWPMPVKAPLNAVVHGNI